MKKNKKTFFQKLLTLLRKNDIIKIEKRKVGFIMLNLNELKERVKGQKFTVNGSKLKQTERNQLKSDTLDALSVDLTEGLEVVGRCKEGVIVAFENDDEGAIYGVVDIVIKNLDFEPEVLLDEYAQAIAEKAERERKLAEKRKAK